MSWHVYGQLQKGEKNYVEALKCFKTALKYAPENLTVLRDTSAVQVRNPLALDSN
jgi:hypothetical protein